MAETLLHPGPRYEALLQLLRTSEALWNGSRVFFAKWDLSSSQFNVLNVLRDALEGLTQIELSRLLIMHRSNITGLVDRLEKRGLLKRNENPDDRRVYRVVLTPKGKKLVGQILPDYYRTAEQIWGKVPAKRANELAKELAILNDNILGVTGAL
ncbi:MAG: MarR family transcriptional regulator [Verrucomicrobiales bacterium]|nr:MarR family transcriptional regulator [Verrucomicrobiales bacterium]